MTKIKQCENCSKDFQPKDYRSRFCNRSCAATFNNKKFIKRPRVQALANCLVCNNKLKSGQSKYCCRKCMGIHKSENAIQKWLNDSDNGSYSNGNIKYVVKKALLEEAQYKCSRCGWCEPNPILGKPILSVDHIDGNWKNNVKSNLVVLCYNCHTLTPTFGILNRGSSSGRRPNAQNRNINNVPIV
jgi:hypothetical protein